MNLKRLAENEHAFHQVQVSIMNHATSPQGTFSLVAFFSEQMAFISICTLDFSASRNLEGFFRTGVSFYFRHLTSNLVCKGREIIKTFMTQNKIFINVLNCE